MAPRVLISDKLSPAAVAIFKERGVEVDVKPGLDKDELAKIIGEYDGLAIRSATKVTAKLLERATKLMVVGRAGIGVDNVDIPAATARGVIVMNTPFGNSITTAEHAIALMMALARELPAANASTHAGKWEKNRFMGVELYAKTLGLIGAGNIGSIVADRANGLKMHVIAYDPFLSPERAVEIGVEKVEFDYCCCHACFALKLDPHEAILFPFSRLGRDVGGRNLPCERKYERDRMLGGGNRIAERRVHDDDAARGGGRNVHIIDADAGAADHFQAVGLFQKFRGDLGRRADGEAVEAVDRRGKLVFVLAEIRLEIDGDAAIFEYLDGGRRQRIGDQNTGAHGKIL